MTDPLPPEARARLEAYLYMLRTETHITAQDAVWGGSGLNTKGVGSLEGDLAQCLSSHDAQAAELSRLAARVGELGAEKAKREQAFEKWYGAPDPSTPQGERGECKHVHRSCLASTDQYRPVEWTCQDCGLRWTENYQAPTLPVDVAGLVEELKGAAYGLSYDPPFTGLGALSVADLLTKAAAALEAAALEAAARRPGEKANQGTDNG